MNQISYEVLRSFINSLPFLMTLLIVVFLFRGSFAKFISRNLLDVGKDRYSDKNDGGEKVDIVDALTVRDEELKKHIRDVLLSEGGKEYFEEYKGNLNHLIEQKKDELTNNALSKMYSERQIEETINQSLSDSVEKITSKLIRDDKLFRDLEVQTLEKLNLIKVSSFLEHLEKEYDAARSTKALMSNMFIIVNMFYFFGLLGFLVLGQGVSVAPAIYFALSFSYIGLGAFVVYMIKFCNARSLTLLSLREDFLKREQLSKMAARMVELGTSEHHVALLQMMSSSVATKEQKINHPYEMLLYGIKDSNIMFKGGKFEIKKEATGKANS